MPEQTTKAAARRRAELARIHCCRTELGLDEDTYRDLLEQVAGVRSSAKLDDAGRAKVLNRLRELGATGKPRGVPHNLDARERGPLLSKVEALLADQSLPWSYADGIARQMFKLERIAFADERQLRAVIAALSKRRVKANREDTAQQGDATS